MNRSTFWYIIAGINAFNFVLALVVGELMAVFLSIAACIASYAAGEAHERLERVDQWADDVKELLDSWKKD